MWKRSKTFPYNLSIPVLFCCCCSCGYHDDRLLLKNIYPMYRAERNKISLSFRHVNVSVDLEKGSKRSGSLLLLLQTSLFLCAFEIKLKKNTKKEINEDQLLFISLWSITYKLPFGTRLHRGKNSWYNLLVQLITTGTTSTTYLNRFLKSS